MAVLNKWLPREGLSSAPLYGLGISAGATFLAALNLVYPMAAISMQVCGGPSKPYVENTGTVAPPIAPTLHVLQPVATTYYCWCYLLVGIEKFASTKGLKLAM